MNEMALQNSLHVFIYFILLISINYICILALFKLIALLCNMFCIVFYLKCHPNATNKVRATEAIDTTQNGIDTILIGDSITQHVRMAKTKNITFSDTSVRELIDILPTILSTHPDGMKIIIHTGSFDILRRKALRS